MRAAETCKILIKVLNNTTKATHIMHMVICRVLRKLQENTNKSGRSLSQKLTSEENSLIMCNSKMQNDFLVCFATFTFKTAFGLALRRMKNESVLKNKSA